MEFEVKLSPSSNLDFRAANTKLYYAITLFAVGLCLISATLAAKTLTTPYEDSNILSPAVTRVVRLLTGAGLVAVAMVLFMKTIEVEPETSSYNAYS